MFHIHVYYIDTDEIPGFSLLLKHHIFIAGGEHTIFIFHVWGYWCRHSLSGARRVSFEISFTKWLRGATTVQLSVTFSISQESTTWCYFKMRFCCYRIFLFFIRILTFNWNRKYKYYCLYFSFITLYPSFITFLWQAFCNRWPL